MSVLIMGMDMPTDEPIRIILHPNGTAIKANAMDYEEYKAVPLVQPQILHLNPKLTKEQLFDAWNRLEENQTLSSLIQKVQEDLYNEAIAESKSRAALQEGL